MNDTPIRPTPNKYLTELGVLPKKSGPVKFAVGPPDGLTSNSWRIWTKGMDVYISCRDNFKEAKVSLHASGRWRIAFTTEAIASGKVTLASDEDRAWEVWDKPPETLPNTVIAFRLIFPTSELAVRPEQRPHALWKDTVFIEAAAAGKVTLVTLFITFPGVDIVHETEASFCLAKLSVGNREAQLVAHNDPEMDLPELIAQGVKQGRLDMEARKIPIPEEAYFYMHGRLQDGSRYIVGARANR